MRKLIVLLLVLSFSYLVFGDTYDVVKWATISMGTVDTVITRYSLANYNMVEKNPKMKWFMKNDFRAYSLAFAEGIAEHYCFKWFKKKNKALGYMVMGMFFVAKSYIVAKNIHSLSHASPR